MDEYNDLFDQASVVGEDDENAKFVIGHDFRTITIPSSKKLLGVTSDEKVNVLYFECPRYYGPVDLNTFDFRINYMNAGDEGGIYEVADKMLSEDEETITFSWVAARAVCKYAGTVRFVVCARVIAGDGEVLQEYNTAIHKLTVIEGLEVDEAAQENGNMIRATTPKHTFYFSIDPMYMKRILITYKQNDAIILEKTEESLTFDMPITVDDEVIYPAWVRLTQQETSLFSADGTVYIQLRVLSERDEAMVSETYTLSVSDVLNDEVLT